jgi:probable F420-dependent oxidoreductase
MSMRFSVQLPTDRAHQDLEFIGQDAIAEMARAVEAAGFDACYVTEHPFPTDGWLGAGGHHAIDPFVSLAVAATTTRTLRLHTNILVLAYRNPFLTAKAVASLDAVSGGRVILGVAAGYLEGEYRALGADFAHRNEITDEALVAMKRAWSEKSLRFRGRDYEATGNTMLPRPLQKPHPPIWVGGNSRRAMRRVVEHADGWLPFPLPAEFRDRTRTDAIESVDDLRRKIELLRELAANAGRAEPLDVCFVPFGHGMNSQKQVDAGAFCETVGELEAIGVTWLALGLPCESRAVYCENVARFGREVIAKLEV